MAQGFTHERGTRAGAALVAGALVAATLALAVAAPAQAATDGSRVSATEYYSLINGLRASEGLPALQIDSTLAASSLRWADQMAATSTLSHDPNLAGAVSGWTKIGENVGTGPTTTSVWDAFLHSAPHLTNLLEPSFTHMGVAIVVDGRGAQWTAHRFVRYATAPAPTTTAPPAPTPTPAPTAPPAPVVTAPADPGDSVDCVNFSTWDNANHWYTYYQPVYGDVAHLDDDGDGVVCEWLPGSPQRVVAQPPTTAAPTTAAPATDSTEQRPTTTVPPAPDDLGADPDGQGEGSVAGTASADPARVSPLIDALRLLG